MRDLLLKHNQHWAGKILPTGIKRELTQSLIATLSIQPIQIVPLWLWLLTRQ